MNNSWYVYLLRCHDNTLYTGVTTDPQRRLHEHNHTTRGARYTRARRPVELVYHECAEDRAGACRREWEIKQLDSAGKRALIAAKTVELVLE
ncbi:MAG: GIY-YIG nuclease family protein [Sedimenticola sp.]